MILQYHTKKSYKIILNGFINVYNIEQNEIEDSLAKEIHELINYPVNNKEDHDNIIHFQNENSYNKNYVSKTNLLISTIFNNVNYVKSIIYYILDYWPKEIKTNFK